VLLGRRSWSSTIYDALAESCAALAAKTGRASDKVRLLQLADQRRTVPADGQGSGKKPPFAATLAGDAVEPVGLLARPTPQSPVSNPKRAKEDALDRVRDAIGVLRELGIDEDTILDQLGFRADKKWKRG
jgi:hypothetical protein